MAQPNFKSDIVIGLEIHFQPNLNTKLFCSCPAQLQNNKSNKQNKTHDNKEDTPNTRTCVVCLGMPGSKPVLNKKAVEHALTLALALNSNIAPELLFSRKSYFYPDLAKNYQISQFELPLGTGGSILLSSGKKVNLERLHLEEDPASLVHPNAIDNSAYSLIDYNRSGTCLIELVTKPEMTSPDEAREFMKKLRTILQYLKIFDEQTGVIKADANVSIKESGYIRSEVKNITGFKEIERALEYEIERQKQAVKHNEPLIMETRAWDSIKGKTTRLRIKETEADYGYIIDTDLVPTDITQGMINAVKKSLPELPDQKVKKFVQQHKLSQLDAHVLAMERVLAELFEKVAEKVNPILAAQWLRHELVRVANYNKLELSELRIEELEIIELLSMVEKKEITDRTAQKILGLLAEKSFSPRKYVEENNLKIISNTNELEKLCKKAIVESEKAVKDYKAGKDAALNSVVGKVMQYTKGTANPEKVKEMLKKMV